MSERPAKKAAAAKRPAKKAAARKPAAARPRKKTETPPAEAVEGRSTTPAELGDRGTALWDALVDKYAFELWEVPIVEAACRQLDDIAKLEAHLRDNGFITTGSMGQKRLDAAVTEVRLARKSLAALLGQLDIPDDVVPGRAEGQPAGPRSVNARRASKAANRRWDNERKRRGDDQPDAEYYRG